MGGCAVLLLGAIVLGVGGYAFYRWRSQRTTNDNTSGESPAVRTESTPQPVASSSPPVSNSNSNQSSPTTTGTSSTWEVTASSLTDAAKTFTLACSPGGTAHSVWGSDIYTADSSICTAAVHAGLITYERGGTVTIELRPGRAVYGASERNGVTTGAFGDYRRSFVFKGANESAEKEGEDVTPILWNTAASILTYEAGKKHKFKCPGGGKQNSVWGTDVYTADSSICNAAVHVGRISLDNGGTVTIELRPGQSSYQGTMRNGVTSNGYGAYPHSFVVR